MWIAIFGSIIGPGVAWIVNNIITKKIDNLEAQQKLDRDLFFKKLDEDREAVENHFKDYVRSDIYKQAIDFYNEKNDSNLKSLLFTITTQMGSIEKNMEIKIESLKDLIKEKINNKKGE